MSLRIARGGTRNSPWARPADGGVAPARVLRWRPDQGRVSRGDGDPIASGRLGSSQGDTGPRGRTVPDPWLYRRPRIPAEPALSSRCSSTRSISSRCERRARPCCRAASSASTTRRSSRPSVPPRASSTSWPCATRSSRRGARSRSPSRAIAADWPSACRSSLAHTGARVGRTVASTCSGSGRRAAPHRFSMEGRWTKVNSSSSPRNTNTAGWMYPSA